MAAARHLLSRAGFGGTPAQVDALVAMGIDKAVDLVVNYGSQPQAEVSPDDFDRELVPYLSQDERQQLVRARRERDEATVERLERAENQARAQDRQQLVELRKWWLARMVETARPLEEKMTLFWHGHFATGGRTVEDSWTMFQQNHLFRTHATGNFATLVLNVIRDPAMIRYLDNNQSRRGRPNENLARELLELFILGEGSGYTEQDIKEGARALTGYTFQDEDFAFQEQNHDAGPKVIFGKKGNWNGDDFARLALSQKACSTFLCGKLHRFFVNDTPDADLPATHRAARARAIEAMAAELRGGQYEVAPVLAKLFRSAHFHDEANRAALIKSPVQLVVQTVRQLGTPVRQLSSLVAACDLMGQNLFEPPNVKGWDGGRAWINTSTLFVRQNVAIYLLTGRRPDIYDWENDGARFDADALAAGAATPEALVDRLLAVTLASPAHPARRDELVRFAAAQTSPAARTERALSTLALITALPEYQLA
ncbi:MAG: DUF1800 domain-containing protein [Phycisphaerales bacterium]